MNFPLILCVIAIVASIVLGNKFKVNIGIIATCFAFLIGTLALDLPANTIVGYWPDVIFFFFIACGLFFAPAVANGTVDRLGKNLLYLCKGKASLVPWVIFLVSIILCALGGSAALTVCAALCFPVGMAAGLNPYMTATAIYTGGCIGCNNPFTGQQGVTIMNLIADSAGFVEEAPYWSMDVYLSRVAILVVIMVTIYFITKSYKARTVEIDAPEQYTPVQKKTLMLMIVASVIMILSMVLYLVAGKKVHLFEVLYKCCQPQSIMFIAAFIAMFMKLAPAKEFMNRLPINTALMIAGFSLLMGVSKAAGLIDFMGGLLGGNIPGWLFPAFCVLITGIMAMFCSGTAVVFPMLFPLVQPICAASGASELGMILGLTLGSLVSNFCPFTNGGAFMLAGCPDEEQKEKLTKQLLILTFASLAIAIVFAMLGFLDLFDFAWSV